MAFSDIWMMKQESVGEWAQELFGGAHFGDARWGNRLVLVARQAARRPSGKVSEVFSDDAERQGAYGLLESQDVSSSQLASTMFSAMVRRCAGEEFVFCPVDGSSLSLADHERSKNFGSVGSRKQGARGLKMINAMVISSHGVPLGLSAQQWWARSERRSPKSRRLRKTEEKETQHWLDAMDKTRQVFAQESPKTKCWFQLDREGDAWPIISQADQDGHWFTVRGNHNRRVILAGGEKSYLRDVLAQQACVTRYNLEVSAGPNRSERTAHMVTRACTVTLDFKDQRTKERFPKALNVVLTREERTVPAGERPVEWMLLTNRPIETGKHLKQIVFGYAQRWRIEEFHRTWKSGACRVEESQLRSMDSAVKWATILAAVAIRIERIKYLARNHPGTPATDEFSAVELRAIKLLRFGNSAKRKIPKGIPTIEEATRWVAEIGGYTGKYSGGPPGSITIARGFRDVQAAVRTLQALEPNCD